jgi:hypothetical protein
MVAVCARLRELQGDQREMVHVIAGNGSGYAVNDARADEFAAAAAELESCVESLVALGVRVKDPDTGLVDFPALRHGQEVLLCWQAGEDAVEWWHGLDSGFAGRSRIDWDGDGEDGD